MLSSDTQWTKATAGSANSVKGRVSSTMAKAQKSPLRTGRGLAVFVLIVELVFSGSPLLGISRKDKFWEKADVSGVVKAVRRHRAGVSSEVECEQLIRLNFKHLYFNALETDRFIAMPKPDKVLERMSKVFLLAADLRIALIEARQLLDGGGELIELQRAVRKIRDCAAGIHDTFHDFFKEDTSGSFSAELPAGAEERARFAEYLATCERILSLLNQELDRYFLNPSPGVVEVSTFRSCSIPVLSLCLEKLSLSFEKSLLE